MPPKTKSVATPPPKRGRGRPPAANPARETFQLRVTSGQRRTWQAAAAASAQTESEWARAGLDVWVRVCARAADLGIDPDVLVVEGIEAHARVRAAVAELTAARSLSTTEERLLRVLAPTEWARRSGG